MRELFQRLRRQAGAQPEIADGIEARAAACFDILAPILGEAADLAKAKAKGMRRLNVPVIDAWRGCKLRSRVERCLQRAIPVG